MLMKGSDIVVESLLEQGVDTIFGYPGGAILEVYDSLYKYQDKIHHVLTLMNRVHLMRPMVMHVPLVKWVSVWQQVDQVPLTLSQVLRQP